MNINQLRQKAFARELVEAVVPVIEMEEAMTEQEKVRNNTLGELNNVLFEQLRALRSIDVSDHDALEAEIARSKATESLSSTIIKNAQTVLEATRMRAEYTNQMAEVPRMLGGD